MKAVKKKAKIFLCVSIVLMLISMIGVSLVQTNVGHISVKHMYWETEAGIGISANLYIPDTATTVNKAPAVVTSHGYLNNKGMQDSNSVELSRRGFVVLAVDQPGCGESDIADYAGKNGSGYNFSAVYQGARELSRLPFVDTSKIGVTGHSMGGMSCNLAVMSDDASGKPIISAVLLNCIDAMYTDSKNTMGGLATMAGLNGKYKNMYGTRDVGMIASKYDEFFQQTMTKDGKVLQAPYFMKSSYYAQSFLNFGKDPTNLGRRNAETFYHETIDGKDALRVIFNPAQIHPWSHFSMRSETATVEFFTKAFGSPINISATSQIWQVKEAFNFVGMIGLVMFIITLATSLLFTPLFEELRADEIIKARIINKKGIIWFVCGSAISTAIAALTYHPVVEFGKNLSFTEQPMIFGIALWAALCGVLSIINMFISYKIFGKDSGVELVESGVKIPLKKIGKTILLGLLVIVAAYACVFFADYFFLSDFRIWNVGIKVFNANTLRMAIFPHVFLFLIFYISYSVASNCFNFNQIGGKHSWANNLVLTIVALLPIIILLAIQYGTYVSTGHMAWSSNNAPMNIAQLFAFLIMIPGASVINRMLYKVTKNPYLPGIITGILIAIISSCNTTSRFLG